MAVSRSAIMSVLRSPDYVQRNIVLRYPRPLSEQVISAIILDSAGGFSMLTPVEERFWGKVKKTDGCWFWVGSTAGGYGQIRKSGQQIPAHRLAWEIHFGSIPDGLIVCHKCDIPLCVRPTHLFLGTHKDNAKDRDNKGRGKWGHGLETHCPKGHVYDLLNTYIDKRGHRFCRACNRAAVSQYQQKNRLL